MKKILALILAGCFLVSFQGKAQSMDTSTATYNNTDTATYKKSEIDTIFPQGDKNPYGKYFTGQTYLTRLSANDTVFNAPIGNVTFEPGARTNWHKHSGGQILTGKSFNNLPAKYNKAVDNKIKQWLNDLK